MKARQVKFFLLVEEKCGLSLCRGDCLVIFGEAPLVICRPRPRTAVRFPLQSWRPPQDQHTYHPPPSSQPTAWPPHDAQCRLHENFSESQRSSPSPASAPADFGDIKVFITLYIAFHLIDSFVGIKSYNLHFIKKERTHRMTKKRATHTMKQHPKKKETDHVSCPLPKRLLSITSSFSHYFSFRGSFTKIARSGCGLYSLV